MQSAYGRHYMENQRLKDQERKNYKLTNQIKKDFDFDFNRQDEDHKTTAKNI